MVTFATMVTFLTKERIWFLSQQGNHGNEGISNNHRNYDNLGSKGNHGYNMNVVKPGDQGNIGNHKIIGNVSNENSYDCA
jgi:hypothetical protein